MSASMREDEPPRGVGKRPLRRSDGSRAQARVGSSRYAAAAGYFVLAGSPEGRVRTLFDDFMSRPAEADEMENGRAMINGTFIPNAPAGLLFHRHGATYADLIDIVFDSEVYREAIIRRVFGRFLARVFAQR